ncbi:acyltransferase family protein [Aquibacillus sediminis]|uniref:acyltransferase family protein n=1 Tax=Aquibacillus sediminis TaxID=2574734 RepID=UPI0011093BE6|nr:acyltransferase family protein [Aquibacillus sediminis]
MQREAFFDNAKVLLIFFVVFGHVIQPLTLDSDPIQVLYHWVYFFHMPAFILLSGFFAKGIGSKSYISKLFKKLIVPYILFHILYTGYYLLLGMDGWQTTFIYPRWSLWFLLSLFCWHLLLIIFKKLPPLLSMSTAVGIAVAIGYIDWVGHTLSLSRTFVFFPFFLLGYWLTKDQLLKVKTKTVKTISIVVMSIVAIGLVIAPPFANEWLLASHSYQALGFPVLGGGFRLGVFVVATLMIVSILAWVPTKHNIFTHIGEKTLYVYLLHGIFIQFFRQTELLKVSNFFDMIGLVIISFAIVLVLASKPVRMVAQPLVEGRFTMLRERFQSSPKYKTSNTST